MIMDFILTVVGIGFCLYLIKILYISELMLDELKKENKDG